jgi:hypothetical protein
VPLKGRVLVPNPPTITYGLPTGPAGALSIRTTWPASLPTDFEVFVQYWISDPVGPKGFAASIGLRATMP